MKKIAYLRPHATLSEYEMSYVELLRDDFNLQIITLGQPAIGGLPDNAVQLSWPDEFVWKGRKRSLLNGIYARLLRRKYHIPGLRRCVKDAKIVQASEATSEWSYQAARLKEKYGYKLLLSCSENQPLFEGRGRTRKDRIRYTLNNIDHAFAIPTKAKDRLIEAGLDESKITVIGHGIDCERFSPEGRSSSERIRIGYCGRFRREKGLKFLIEAIKGLDVDLVLLGSGPEEDQLKLSAQSTSTTFLNALPYDQIHTFYKDIDIFVLPSVPLPGLVEQFGFVLLEAMASEIPVIATNIGGIPEVLGDKGILVPPSDVNALKHEIKKLSENKQRRETLGKEGRTRVLENFRRVAVANKMRKVYHELIS